MTAVAVVIPNWNTGEYLDRCLDAVATQDGADIEVIVVENGSRDGSGEILARRGVRTISLAENAGFARAVNLGAAESDAPLVLVLNADCFLDQGCVRTLAATLAADRSLGGVQPLILQAPSEPAGARIYSSGQCLTRAGSAFERGWGAPATLAPTATEEVFGVSGAACLLRRELFSELGGYDESYFAFFEDVDLNARARLAGWRFACVPDAGAVHVGHAGWGRQPRPQRFNVELTVRNRLATAVKVLPGGGVAGALVLTLRSVVAGPFRGSGSAALRGAVAAVRWTSRLRRERARLRGSSPELLDSWLVRGAVAGPDPRRASSRG
jgi:GT2 family glycosyltransferase